MKNKQPFFTKVPSSGLKTLEQTESIRKHLSNMENYKYITRCQKEAPYYGGNNNYLDSRKKTAIKMEIENCKRFLASVEQDEAKEIAMLHLENELRMILVKNFIA